MDFNRVLRKRASIRKYSDKKVSVEDIMEAIQAANLAPSPGNLPIVSFMVVEDSETKKGVVEACQQEFVQDAKFIVIVFSNDKKAKIMFDERAEKYIGHHVGAAIENFLLKITDLGLASCWVETFSDDTLRNALRIPDEFKIEAIIPVSYQSKIDSAKQKPKYSLENRIFFHTWKNKFYKIPTSVKREDL